MTTDEVALPDISGIEMVDAKQLMRSALRTRRSKLNPKEVDDFTQGFTDSILEFAANAETVSLYVSVNNEPVTLRALDILRDRGVRVLLPKLGPGLARMWAEYGRGGLEVEAPGRPPSPTSDPLPSEAVEEADAIIVPALAINRDGIRLGQGGGWYDRILKLNVTDRVGALIYPWEFVSVPLPHDEQDVPIPWALLPGEIVSTS